jgi:hypothetical protein
VIKIEKATGRHCAVGVWSCCAAFGTRFATHISFKPKTVRSTSSKDCPSELLEANTNQGTTPGKGDEEVIDADFEVRQSA